MAWNIRTSTDRAAMAALALLAALTDELAALPDELEAPPAVVPELELPVLGVVPAGEEDDDARTDDDAVVGVDETEVVALGTVPETDTEVAPAVGGGLASAAFTSAPVPQGIASPSG